MTKSLKLFAGFFFVSFLYAWSRFHRESFALFLLVGPTVALYQLLCLNDKLASRPPSHWLFKVPGVFRIKELLHSALSLPQAVRVLVLLVCIFGGLELSKFVSSTF